jgi:hypothetical protein
MNGNSHHDIHALNVHTFVKDATSFVSTAH